MRFQFNLNILNLKQLNWVVSLSAALSVLLLTAQLTEHSNLTPVPS